MADFDDTTIECTRCGASVYYDLNVCPECGLNFYEPESAPWQETWTAEPGQETLSVGGISIAGVLLGVLAAGGVLFVFQLFGSWAAQLHPLGFDFLVWVAGLLAGFTGGFLAGWLSENRHLIAAAIVGCLTIILSIVFEAYWFDLSVTGLINLRAILTWGLILTSALSGGILTRNRALRVDHLLVENAEDIYHELMVKIGYDRALAERLIEYERQKAPAAPRTILIRSAIRRWERDNQL